MSVSARERRLLVLLAVVAALAGGRLLWLAASPPAGGRDRAAGARATERAAARGAPLAELESLRTDRLDVRPAAFEVGRDLFAYAPPPAPPGPSAEELERARASAAARRAAAPGATRQPPRLALRYLGSFGRPEAKIAVFTAPGGGEVLNAAEGDVVLEAFRVVRIGFESVDLGFVGFPDEPPQRLEIAGPAGGAETGRGAAGARRRRSRDDGAAGEDGG